MPPILRLLDKRFKDHANTYLSASQILLLPPSTWDSDGSDYDDGGMSDIDNSSSDSSAGFDSDDSADSQEPSASSPAGTEDSLVA